MAGGGGDGRFPSSSDIDKRLSNDLLVHTPYSSRNAFKAQNLRGLCPGRAWGDRRFHNESKNMYLINSASKQDLFLQVQK